MMKLAVQTIRATRCGALLALVLLAGVGSGCKGKTVVRENPQTRESLTQCEGSLKEKVSYINTLNATITKLESGGTTTAGQEASDGTVVVMIEGEVMKISAGKSKGPFSGPKDAKGNAKDLELYEAFVKQLRGSRGSIKKCYQYALKKNSALASRTITLNIGVQYRTNGVVKKANLSPRVSEQFNKCMDTVAKKWKLPAMPRPVSFNYKQTLTPE